MLSTGSLPHIKTKDSQCVSCTNGASTVTTLSKPVVYIILGSTRTGRSSEKIGNTIKKIADKRKDIKIEIIDIKNFNLPFFDDPQAPSRRKKISDPEVQKWSEKIKEAHAYIFVFPEYNAGYPGVLKNALDSLYPEWNNKPAALISYSGGPSGGTTAASQLRQVLHELEMNPIKEEINIPNSWKAFDAKDNLVDEQSIEKKLFSMIDELVASIKNTIER